MNASSIASLIAPALSAGDHLVDVTVAGLPTTPASMTIFILLIGSVGAVVWFGRSKGPPL